MTIFRIFDYQRIMPLFFFMLICIAPLILPNVRNIHAQVTVKTQSLDLSHKYCEGWIPHIFCVNIFSNFRMKLYADR